MLQTNIVKLPYLYITIAHHGMQNITSFTSNLIKAMLGMHRRRIDRNDMKDKIKVPFCW
jgi:hypothetical protein